MEARLRQALARAEEVARELADPQTAREPGKLKALGREHSQPYSYRQRLADRLARLEKDMVQARQLEEENDPEMAALVRDDLARLPAESIDCSPNSMNCSFPGIRTMIAMPSWRSVPVPAETKRRFSRRSCSACTPDSPSDRD